MELALNSQVNQQFSVRAFSRYGLENYDTVRVDPSGLLVEYADRSTFRLGISSEYVISPTFSVFGGVDFIPTSFEEGHVVPFGGSADDQSEEILNAYIGVSVKLNDCLTGTASYNYTNSSSDFADNDYDRNRFTLGISTEF